MSGDRCSICRSSVRPVYPPPVSLPIDQRGRLCMECVLAPDPTAVLNAVADGFIPPETAEWLFAHAAEFRTMRRENWLARFVEAVKSWLVGNGLARRTR